MVKVHCPVEKGGIKQGALIGEGALLTRTNTEGEGYI